MAKKKRRRDEGREPTEWEIKALEEMKRKPRGSRGADSGLDGFFRSHIAVLMVFALFCGCFATLLAVVELLIGSDGEAKTKALMVLAVTLIPIAAIIFIGSAAGWSPMKR
jgi:hypothetical protein